VLSSGILARRQRLFNRLRKNSGRGTRRTCENAAPSGLPQAPQLSVRPEALPGDKLRPKLVVHPVRLRAAVFSGEHFPQRLVAYVESFHRVPPADVDLPIRILRRPLAPCGKSSRRNHPRWALLGSAQPPSQPVELVGKQGEGEPKDGIGNLGAFADSNDARPLHRRRPRRDDCGSGKVSRCRGIRIGERSVEAVGEIVGRSFRCHVR
jgi:hypothetical protein